MVYICTQNCAEWEVKIKKIGTSSATKTRSIQQALELIELQKKGFGKQQEGTRLFTQGMAMA